MKTQQALIDAYRTRSDTALQGAIKYAQGKAMAASGQTIAIGINGEVSVIVAGRAYPFYCKLGYHGNTADLLQGWLDGGATIIDRRTDLGFSSCGYCGGYAHSAGCIDGRCPHCGHAVLPNIEDL